jgi:DNA (cytosine-5)-methyltransferase 1
MENVQGSQLRRDLVLCGLSFELRVFRHRVFELSDVTVPQPAHPTHRGHRVAGWRHSRYYAGDMVAVYGDGGGKGTLTDWQEAMGIDWMTNRLDLAEAIPPAYTAYIGRQILADYPETRAAQLTLWTDNEAAA